MYNNKYSNKQLKYDDYAKENGLKRLKMYHKDQKQWNNFKMYIEHHQHIEKLKGILSDNFDNYNNYKNRNELDKILYTQVLYRHNGDYPNLYYYEIVKLKEEFDKFLSEYKNKLNKITLTTECDSKFYNGETRDYISPRNLYHHIEFHSEGLGLTEIYIIINNNKFNLVNYKNCEYIFENWNELNE